MDFANHDVRNEGFEAKRKAAVLALGELQACYIGRTVGDLRLRPGQELTAEDIWQSRENFDQHVALTEAITIVLRAKEPA